jgi:hypothetical protein
MEAELNDSPTARALMEKLPLTVDLSRWGEEFYGSVGLGKNPEAGARDVMEVGELAYWPPGDAFCVFFGPTPASSGDEPRAASEVTPIGRINGDPAALRSLGGRVRATIEPVSIR